MRHSMYVVHNIEVAHRLLRLPGKCQNIHGHSMNVILQMYGTLNERGILAGLDFAAVKKAFRTHLDTVYDHHLLLNADDPWSGLLSGGARQANGDSFGIQALPGLTVVDGDPTTENIAGWICKWACDVFARPEIDSIEVSISETATNGAVATHDFNWFPVNAERKSTVVSNASE